MKYELFLPPLHKSKRKLSSEYLRTQSLTEMAHYDPTSWFSLIFDVYTRHVVKILFPLLLFICIYTAALTFFILDHLELAPYLEDMKIFHSVLGVILGLFLVIRTNTAYDKWWEGRKIWGNLINDCRSLAIKVCVFLPKKEDRHFFSYMIPNFVFALKGHLREGVNIKELFLKHELEKKRIEKSEHKPNAISLQMYELLQTRHQEGKLSAEQFLILDKEAKALLDHLGGCERIKNTPIPHAYNLYIKKFIFIYTLTLPFTFIPHMGYWSILLVGLILYILVSIELIAEEIEEPFGLDTNDLPLASLCLTIKLNIEEILLKAPAYAKEIATTERSSKEV